MDNLSNQLIDIIDKSQKKQLDGFYIIDEDTLMQKLVIYITKRDYEIYQHAFNKGKEYNGQPK